VSASEVVVPAAEVHGDRNPQPPPPSRAHQTCALRQMSVGGRTEMDGYNLLISFHMFLPCEEKEIGKGESSEKSINQPHLVTTNSFP
jgi:hypothetical protein